MYAKIMIIVMQKCQKGSILKHNHGEMSMSRSKFIFDSVDILYYNLNNVSLVRGETYIDAPEYLKTKKATIVYAKITYAKFMIFVM